MPIFVLDTDHLSLFQRNHPRVCEQVIQVLESTPEAIATTIVSVEEQLAGRLAQIKKAQSPEELVYAYHQLGKTFEMFSNLKVVTYDLNADGLFRKLRKDGIRIGTLDLRIASISLSQNGVIVTRNQVDFGKIPGATIEDWSV